MKMFKTDVWELNVCERKVNSICSGRKTLTQLLKRKDAMQFTLFVVSL